jgi:hypothetical protein
MIITRQVRYCWGIVCPVNLLLVQVGAHEILQRIGENFQPPESFEALHNYSHLLSLTSHH